MPTGIIYILNQKQTGMPAVLILLVLYYASILHFVSFMG